MHSPLFNVIYCSCATRQLSQKELLELSEISRVNNAANQITGMLLYRSGAYLQFLEGQREQVSTLVRKLGKDPRHGKVKVIHQGVIGVRSFPQWSMAFKSLSGVNSSKNIGYAEHFQAGHSDSKNSIAQQKLLQLFESVLLNIGSSGP